jgi:hypothetical protein
VGKKFTANKEVVFTELKDGSAVLLHLETKYYHSLNDTGCFLWKALEENESGTTDEELAEKLFENFDVELDKAREDVNEFLRDLKALSLIK